MSGGPGDYRVTYSAASGGEDVSAQLFYRDDQFAEVLGSDDGLKVQFFGPSEGYPPELALDIVVELLQGSGNRLREIAGDEPDAA
jgi:hypothetical protein